MNYKIILILLSFLSGVFAYGQINRCALLGAYEYGRLTDKKPTIDTIGWQHDSIPILSVWSETAQN